MSYYFSTTMHGDFDAVEKRVTEQLKHEGFGVLTRIDVSATLQQKLDVSFPPYVILGACNPALAYQALLTENKIGTMLPCSVVVRQKTDGAIEVAAVDPMSSMQAVDNHDLLAIAERVGSRLKLVVDALR